MNIWFRHAKLAFSVSRFRFWLYLGGTYVTGYIFGADNLQDFVSLSFLLQLIYFMVVANVFLYGINDLFDQDTDQFNIKKDDKEIRIQNTQEADLKRILLVTTLLSLLLFIFLGDWTERIIFAIFFFLSYAYSAQPFRFKSRPIIDFSSNILYVIPGFLGYYQTSSELPPVLLIVALFFWTGAMHLFSAIPDIEADKQANVITTAVYVGRKVSLAMCFVFWFIFVFISVIVFQAFLPIGYLGFLYPLIPLSLLVFPALDIDRVYWYYPYINSLLGLGISLLAGWNLLLEFFDLLF